MNDSVYPAQHSRPGAPLCERCFVQMDDETPASAANPNVCAECEVEQRTGRQDNHSRRPFAPMQTNLIIRFAPEYATRDADVIQRVLETKRKRGQIGFGKKELARKDQAK